MPHTGSFTAVAELDVSCFMRASDLGELRPDEASGRPTGASRFDLSSTFSADGTDGT